MDHLARLGRLALSITCTAALLLGLMLAASPRARADAIRFGASSFTKGAADLLYCALAGCTMTGPIVGPNGAVGAPTIQFGSSPDGFYLSNTHTIGATINGSVRYQFTPSVFDTALPITFDGASSGAIFDTVTTDVTTVSNQDFTMGPNGTGAVATTKHFKASGAQASADATTGTCTSVTVSGTDVRGTITATCTAGQTVIMSFGAAYGTAPLCTISPVNAAADVVTLGTAFATASTTAMTLTGPTAVTAGSWAYHCIQ